MAEVKRRGGPLVQKILDAVLTEISEVGLERLSVERIATAAGVNKTTIYRRWPDQRALIAAALDMIADIAPLPDTGNFQSDLEQYFRRFAAALAHPGMRVVLRYRHAPAEPNQERSVLRDRFEAEGAARMALLTRARARGEIAPAADLNLLSQIIGGAAERVLLENSGNDGPILALAAYFADAARSEVQSGRSA